MAARELKRPVKVVYTRTQMFTGHGYRPYTIQKVALGADADGKLTAIVHEACTTTSTLRGVLGRHHELHAPWSTPARTSHAPLKIAGIDLSTPTWMRAPGESSGMFALECAMDELAYALEDRPAGAAARQLRRDATRRAASRGRARRCGSATGCGAEKFGWTKRKPEPRSMRDGRLLVGWGMATGVWGASRSPPAPAMHAARRRHGARRQRDAATSAPAPTR